MSWEFLATEIRVLILNVLFDDGCCVARFATVSREWKTIIEQKTFSRLTLESSRLRDFDKITKPRKQLVRYIWLCIELQEYSCSQCEHEETDLWHESNTNIIENVLRQTFGILSSWKTNGTLTLDFSVHSPSDAMHQFKYIQFWPDNKDISQSCQEITNVREPDHGCVNNSQVSKPSEQSINRLFEDIEMPAGFWEGLPSLSAITRLLLRRQTRRRWEPRDLEKLIRLLPNLREICYEPWREWSRVDQRWTDQSNQWFLRSLGSRPLRKLVLFEDLNDVYIATFQGVHKDLDAEPVRTASNAVGQALAVASLNLEYLSASFIVDAWHFLQACKPDWFWKKLATLVLTSRTLVPKEDCSKSNDLLQLAAVAAMAMPELHTLELWNVEKGLACVFQYQASTSSRTAVITWRGSWDLSLDPRVVRTWEAVASKRASCELKIIKEALNDDVSLNSHGDAIRGLKLVNQVVSPISLLQIQNEVSIGL